MTETTTSSSTNTNTTSSTPNINKSATTTSTTGNNNSIFNHYAAEGITKGDRVPTLYSTFHKESIEKVINPNKPIKPKSTFTKLLEYVPPIKYRFGREFFKFAGYLIYPFMVVFAISQPAVKEWIAGQMPDTSKYHKEHFESEEEREFSKALKENEMTNQTSYSIYWQEKAKNDERVKKFLENQRVYEDQQQDK
ncbi:hypothetical protein ABK040_008061 [Willaertia magna]